MGDELFFDRIAGQWDATRAADAGKIGKLVELIGIAPGSRVLDAGSGTGVLLPYIHKVVGNEGQITAVDFSANMLQQAKTKYAALRNIEFVVADIMNFSTAPGFDHVICFNFFPHVKNKSLFLQHIRNALNSGGMLTIMHDLSRQQVNAVHQASAAVKEDRLACGETVSQWLTGAGYEVICRIDDSDCYFIKARKT
ncbi:class I SAM-dependent methyltransferase [Sporomusa termitida]|uniref:Ubiquinone/menaquinone biosynthesis C-methyltransferase UbiE n=1 Tax=Sporomusa termitida TaxID=2377 RepID=A0A517DNY3_9FIRM|nr:class I SAM-dependent methyltransferase [Sporomusa termitida]QDR79062.1 Ubiquinone/menaquinone biosynthesis C-methyltransferase UbiE [Sporomusa termitida]